MFAVIVNILMKQIGFSMYLLIMLNLIEVEFDNNTDCMYRMTLVAFNFGSIMKRCNNLRNHTNAVKVGYILSPIFYFYSIKDRY